MKKLRKFSIFTNLMSLLLYTISLFTWIFNDLANEMLINFSVITLALYLIFFIAITTMSNSKNYTKNIKRYKKLMKYIKTFINLLNLIIITISTISMFSISLKNIITIVVNSILITINVMNLSFKIFVYLIKYKLSKRFRKKSSTKKTFLGFVFQDDFTETNEEKIENNESHNSIENEK